MHTDTHALDSQALDHETLEDVEHEHHHLTEMKVFGFWIYLMTDCVLFACLFATFAVLVPNTAGGPAGKGLFALDFVLTETFLLLFSSITYGFVILAMHKLKIKQVAFWLIVTALFGIGFVAMELWEFNHLIHQGYGPERSGFLSAFFGLVGTHGLHVSFGLVWIFVMLIHIAKTGLTETNQMRLMCLSLFWHFLDVVWICVFSVVYLFGAVI
ncbi:MAG: cytochrome o ubiquinol oxidase subunit III [Cellvibrionales bacterium]|nr:cytochrome o ubiquinol oxidase subunit III [Cellvibrionales bacterium]